MEYQLLTSSISTNNSIERVFANRGIEPSNINHYLHTTKEDILDPSSFAHMERGINMLLSHLNANNKIFIQIDPDVDGFSSAAALINYLYEIYPHQVLNNISYGLHTGKQHGIIIEEIPENTKLAIYPDSASNDLEQHKILKEQGIDVLILDHHTLEYNSLDPKFMNACIINNQDGCYSNTTLSGAGVVYKFCQMLDKTLNQNFAEKIIDLATLGIVSDMMDLRDYETKAIITIGMNNIINPFFTAFVEKQSYSLKGEVTPFGIAFYIAPYINAVIRIGSQEEKLLLFESMLNHKAYEKIPSTKRGCKGQFETRVEQACRNCVNIKNRQTKARDTSLEIIEDIIQKQDLLKNPILIIQLPRLLEPNLTGLMAN